ncbi:ExbD/TolR family protein [Leeia aquatica]|uniref:Biopolymer transporter ExbD n=1 Tax=Leeia aquatica TaxID=2725557 RepID=A0A847SFQ7_9NEIS|nr:biopolymer transporter ExbD [Leeia aquatica]NLR76058.1 biopolymer transporter ExbD [Leeia aquatica]
MAFGRFGGQAQGPQAEINMVPLIDVMLVLLVIFMLSAPLMTHAVRLSLPNAQSSATPPEPAKVELSLDAQGQLFWDGAQIPREQLGPRLQQLARQQPQPALHLRADQSTRYQALADIMAEASRQGVKQIGFISDPHPAP